MKIVFKDRNLHSKFPSITEDVYVSYKCKINKDNFKLLYDRTLELIESTEFNVFNVYEGKTYLLNPKFGYPVEISGLDFHQSTNLKVNEIRNKQAVLMYKLNLINGVKAHHQIEMKSNKRGLNNKDLFDFFTWVPNQIIIPELFQSDCVGVQGLNLYKEDDYLCIKTSNIKGLAIPVYHPNGNIYKYQIKMDMVRGTVKLKAKAQDGFTVMHSEYCDPTGIYYLGDEYKITKSNFTGIEVQNVFTDETIQCELGEDISEFFPNRPTIIYKIYPEMKAKYIWLPRGSLIPDNEFGHKLTSANPTYLTNKAGNNNTVILTEGTLKGYIVNKYYAEDNLITIATPGIMKSALKEVVNYVSRLNNIKEILIAYDTDASKNKLVTEAVSFLYQKLYKKFNTHVISWDNNYKGFDDYLLNNKIRKIDYGTPRDFYPIEKSAYPYPYHITGKRATKLEWQLERY